MWLHNADTLQGQDSGPCVAAYCRQAATLFCNLLQEIGCSVCIPVLQAAEAATDGTKAAPGGEPEVMVASEQPLDELGAAASLKHPTSAKQHEVSPRHRAPSAPLEASQEQESEERPPAPAATAGGVPDQALDEAGRLVRS